MLVRVTLEAPAAGNAFRILTLLLIANWTRKAVVREEVIKEEKRSGCRRYKRREAVVREEVRREEKRSDCKTKDYKRREEKRL